MGTERSRGLYKIRGKHGSPDVAYVASQQFRGENVGEDVYREQAYEPAFEALPWLEEYLGL